MWMDEVFSYRTARLGFGDMFRAIINDIVHPPLFYLLLKIWMLVGGESLAWLKLFPVLFSILTLVPFYFLCRELNLNLNAINVALALISVNGYMIYYAQELRMYSLLLFFTITSLWIFTLCVKNEWQDKRFIIALFVINLLFIYTQYFGWLVVATQFAFLLFFQRRKGLLPFVLLCLALGLCFSPWVFVVAKSVSQKHGLAGNLGWIKRPGLSEVVWYFAMLHGTFPIRRSTVIGLALFCFPLPFLLRQMLKTKERNEKFLFAGLFMFAFLPTLAALIASFVMKQSLWGERYLIITSVPYLMLLVTAAWQLKPDVVKKIIIACFLIWAVFAGFLEMYRDESRFRWGEITQKMIEADSAGNENIPLFALSELIAVPVKYSLERTGRKDFQVSEVKLHELQNIIRMKQKHFWVGFLRSDWNEARQPQEMFQNAGCRVGTEIVTETSKEKISIFKVECNSN